jgi:hypothetical protein
MDFGTFCLKTTPLELFMKWYAVIQVCETFKIPCSIFSISRGIIFALAKRNIHQSRTSTRLTPLKNRYVRLQTFVLNIPTFSLVWSASSLCCDMIHYINLKQCVDGIPFVV